MIILLLSNSRLNGQWTAASFYPQSRSLLRSWMLQDSAVTVQAASHAARHDKSFISYLFWDLNCIPPRVITIIWFTLQVHVYTAILLYCAWMGYTTFVILFYFFTFLAIDSHTTASGWLSCKPLGKEKKKFLLLYSLLCLSAAYYITLFTQQYIEEYRSFFHPSQFCQKSKWTKTPITSCATRWRCYTASLIWWKSSFPHRKARSFYGVWFFFFKSLCLKLKKGPSRVQASMDTFVRLKRHTSQTSIFLLPQTSICLFAFLWLK